ncbi:MAG: ABC transporter ATP-binding protein SaoA [Syntrophobacteraceae bacterium]
MQLDVKNVSKVFNSRTVARTVLNRVSFTIREGQFVTLLGPSGCGKTTLLTIIAGFQEPTEGIIELNGAPVTKPGPDRAFVFQDYALFPWMSVRENILYPMKQQKLPRGEREELLQKLLSMAHLEGQEHLYPNQISGGMKQRTAVIRALACNPQVLLMDEPLGAVDYQMRQMLQEELEAIWLNTRTTVLMVTHDIDEAIYLSDRVIVMSYQEGRIIEDMQIRLDRPRERRGPRYHEHKDHLTDLLMTSHSRRIEGAEPRGKLLAL